MNSQESTKAAIREAIGKPEGELTQADFDKVTERISHGKKSLVRISMFFGS